MEFFRVWSSGRWCLSGTRWKWWTTTMWLTRFWILDTGIVIFSYKTLVARILVLRFWSQDSGHNHRGSGHKILVTGILDTGIVILVTGMATGYNSRGHGQQSVCVTLSLVGKIARNSFHKVFTISCHVVIAKQSFQWVSGKARKLSNSGHNFWKQLLSLCWDLLLFFNFLMTLESKSLYRTYIVFWPNWFYFWLVLTLIVQNDIWTG